MGRLSDFVERRSLWRRARGQAGPAGARRYRCPVALGLAAVLGCVVAPGVAASSEIRTAGDVLQYVLPATAAGLTAGFRDREGAIEFAESAAVTLAVTYTLKYTISERRPNGGAHSFPSGHTSISFASAEFIRGRYGWEYGVPAYAAAVFVGYSRVASREHHTYDVVAGAAIGFVSSYLFTKPYHGWKVDATADTRSWGLQLSREW